MWSHERVPRRFGEPNDDDFEGGAGYLTSAAMNFVSRLYQKRGFESDQAKQWSTLVDEDFRSSFSFFNGGLDSTVYQSAKGRTGVICLLKSASI